MRAILSEGMIGGSKTFRGKLFRWAIVMPHSHWLMHYVHLYVADISCNLCHPLFIPNPTEAWLCHLPGAVVPLHALFNLDSYISQVLFHCFRCCTWTKFRDSVVVASGESVEGTWSEGNFVRFLTIRNRDNILHRKLLHYPRRHQSFEIPLLRNPAGDITIAC
jgi:hypothetical protein